MCLKLLCAYLEFGNNQRGHKVQDVNEYCEDKWNVYDMQAVIELGIHNTDTAMQGKKKKKGDKQKSVHRFVEFQHFAQRQRFMRVVRNKAKQ